jgi:hypothetical protein
MENYSNIIRYECKMCGKKLGDSLGDMERHILTEHMKQQIIYRKVEHVNLVGFLIFFFHKR